MRFLFFLSFLFLGMGTAVNTAKAEDSKRAMTFDDVREWQRITNRFISNNGQWVGVTIEKWRGDGDRNGTIPNYAGDTRLSIYDTKGNEVKAFCPISWFSFSKSSTYAIVVTKENEASKHDRALKEQNEKGSGTNSKSKAKKAETPMDTLWIHHLADGISEEIDSVRYYRLSDAGDWIAYQTGRKDSTLCVRTLDNKTNYKFSNVKECGWAKKANVLYFLSVEGGKPDTITLQLLDLSQTKPLPQLIKQTTGRIEKISISEDGSQVAFLHSTVAKDKGRTNGMSLWLGKNDQHSEAVMLSDSVNSAFVKGWEISPNGTLRFSKAGDKLVFGVAPIERKPDTTMLKAERPDVQVWSWDEAEQYTVQDYNKNRDARKTYEAVALLGSGKIFQIADSQFDHVTAPFDLKGKLVIVSDSKPYSNANMWEGRTRRDFYVVNIEIGERRLLSKADYNNYRFSPSGKYAYCYAESDSSWVTVDLETLERFVITTPKTLVAWDEDNDTPSYPNSYGIAGWLPEDEALLIYDRYDIWKVPARGGNMENMTKNGREKKLRYRLIQIDRENAGAAIHPMLVQYLSAFNEKTKGTEFYRTSFKKPAEPKFLLGGDYQLAALAKGKDAGCRNMIFTKESFEYAPDVYIIDETKFKNPIQLTHLVDQQKQFIWGTAELIEWTSYNGVYLQGMLFKPENFDPTKKYPMVVNFYERYTDTFHSYRVPAPNRSGPDYHTYLSNGYIIFNPDIRYKDGHPGESCFDCVMSGIDKVLSLGFVDEKRIGGSGHSWGGYQYAYLATRTDRFAAIEAGAPVVNMFSAYGGIRWGSGKARAFQYEHTQSRIGASPWEAPELYTENSPLFSMDKVTTPILIMHNDTDGHVPWYQGIEYFVAMKRLGKPCWMLNYTGEPHWPVKMANRFDFQKRLMQFFDHYLKDAPMPAWMSEGVKAVDQPYDLGY